MNNLHTIQFKKWSIFSGVKEVTFRLKRDVRIVWRRNNNQIDVASINPIRFVIDYHHRHNWITRPSYKRWPVFSSFEAIPRICRFLYLGNCCINLRSLVRCQLNYYRVNETWKLKWMYRKNTVFSKLNWLIVSIKSRSIVKYRDCFNFLSLNHYIVVR